MIRYLEHTGKAFVLLGFLSLRESSLSDLWHQLSFSFSRVGPETELRSSGFKSSSQVARLEDILKSEPKKHSLSAPGLRLRPVPALSVVLNPTVDSSLKFYERLRLVDDDYEAREKNHGYNPGPFDERGWLLDKNKVPIRDYNHEYFNEVKGGDFR